MKFLLLLSIFLLCTFISVAQNYILRADASPTRVNYGSDNNVNIIVTVSNPDGTMVPNNTLIYFYTTLGYIPELAYTQNGRVSVILSNNAGPGIADITCQAGETQAKIRITYIGQGETAPPTEAKPFYELTGKQLYYNFDNKVFEIYDNAQFLSAGYIIKANAMNIDSIHGIVLARGKIIITDSKNTLTAEEIYFDFNTGQGYAVTLTDNMGFKSFSLPTLKFQDDPTARTRDYTIPESPKTASWIVSNKATVYPGDYILFKTPKFYLNNFDHCLLRLPYHVLDMRASDVGALFNFNIALTSSAGLYVDFPVYYDASSSHVGSIKFRNVLQGSPNYRGYDGIQVSVEEEYRINDSGDGGIYFDDINRKIRSVSWDHRQDFGETRCNFNSSYSRYSAASPYTTHAGVSVSRDLGATNLYLSTSTSFYDKTNSVRSDLSLAPPPLRFGKTGYGFTFSPFLAYDLNKSVSNTGVATTTNLTSEGIRAGFNTPSYRLLGGSLNPRVSQDITNDSTGITSSSFDSSLSYNRQFGQFISSSLNYSHSKTVSNRGSAMPASRRYSFSLTGNSPRAWNAFLYSSYSVGSDIFYHNGGFNYQLPWDKSASGQRRWTTTANLSYTTGKNSSFNDSYSIGRSLGAYSLILHYSPKGINGSAGIGASSGKNWSLEVARTSW